MTTSRNGWDVYKSYGDSHLTNFPWVTGKVRKGDHYTVLEYIARRFNNEVEKIDVSASWGHNPRPVRGYTNVWSEHATGTAIDLNAPQHPIRVAASKTFSAAQIARIRQIMRDCHGSARWGGEWSRPDGMHFELIGGNAKVSAMARRINGGSAGTVKPAGSVSKPAAKPKPSGKGWPAQPLPVTSKHTKESDAAWRSLMAAVGYKNKDLGYNLQSWLNDLRDPRTGKGYYPMPPLHHDGIIASYGVKALQRKLYDTKDAKGRRLYTGASDGKRYSRTIKAEIKYLNLPANRGV